jgi:hypothetical protein
VNMILKSNISKEKRTKWLMHSIGGCMRCMLQPLACTILIEKIEFWKLENEIIIICKQRKCYNRVILSRKLNIMS